MKIRDFRFLNNRFLTLLAFRFSNSLGGLNPVHPICNRRLRTVLIALVPVAVLAACGGGTTAPAPPPAGPNTSLTSLVSNETFPTISAVMAADLDNVGATSNVSANESALSSTSTIEYDAVSDAFKIDMHNGAANFTQTFPKDSISGPDTTNSYRTYQVTRADNTIDELVILIPGEATQNLSYVTYGIWNSTAASTRNTTLGTFVFGVQTPAGDMPTTGGATYTGLTAGTLNQSNTLFNVAGDMSMAVNFGTGTVTGSFTNMGRENLQTGDVSSWRDFTTTGSITAGTNAFSGTAASNDAALSGTFNGAFFGPVSGGTPPEIGGGWALSGPGGETAVGGFVGKR